MKNIIVIIGCVLIAWSLNICQNFKKFIKIDSSCFILINVGDEFVNDIFFGVVIK